MLLPSQVNRSLSNQIAKRLVVPPKAGWHHAWRAVALMGSLSQAFYVEGWIVALDTGEMLEHGWIELNNQIIDPSLGHEERWVYFGGVRFTQYETHLVMRRHKSLPVVRRGEWGGMENALYQQAHKEAVAFAHQGEQRKFSGPGLKSHSPLKRDFVPAAW